MVARLRVALAWLCGWHAKSPSSGLLCPPLGERQPRTPRCPLSLAPNGTTDSDMRWGKGIQAAMSAT